MSTDWCVCIYEYSESDLHNIYLDRGFDLMSEADDASLPLLLHDAINDDDDDVLSLLKDGLATRLLPVNTYRNKVSRKNGNRE